MNLKQTPFRAVGQRSIASSFLSPSSNPFKVSKEATLNEASEKGSPLSLSDFLQRKLNETSGLPRTGKSKPFLSLLVPRELSVPVDEQSQNVAKKGKETDSSSVVEKVVLEQFKHTGTAKGDCVGSTSNGEAENSDIADVPEQESRKRKSFQGGNENEKHNNRKHFTVLGGKKRKENKCMSKENQVPTYNHYANGGGWWDSNMEGVDNEEVGLSEIWEGVGSTTFGGIIDWH